MTDISNTTLTFDPPLYSYKLAHLDYSETSSSNATWPDTKPLGPAHPTRTWASRPVESD